VVDKLKTFVNKRNKYVVCQKAKFASSFFERLKGLMFSKNLPDCDGLLLSPCNSIHTFFMNYSLDVIFLDNQFKVIKILRGLKPWRLSWIYFRSTQVLEMKAGSLNNEIIEGDMLEALDV